MHLCSSFDSPVTFSFSTLGLKSARLGSCSVKASPALPRAWPPSPMGRGTSAGLVQGTGRAPWVSTALLVKFTVTGCSVGSLRARTDLSCPGHLPLSFSCLCPHIFLSSPFSFKIPLSAAHPLLLPIPQRGLGGALGTKRCSQPPRHPALSLSPFLKLQPYFLLEPHALSCWGPWPLPSACLCPTVPLHLLKGPAHAPFLPGAPLPTSDMTLGPLPGQPARHAMGISVSCGRPTCPLVSHEGWRTVCTRH